MAMMELVVMAVVMKAAEQEVEDWEMVAAEVVATALAVMVMVVPTVATPAEAPLAGESTAEEVALMVASVEITAGTAAASQRTAPALRSSCSLLLVQHESPSHKADCSRRRTTARTVQVRETRRRLLLRRRLLWR